MQYLQKIVLNKSPRINKCLNHYTFSKQFFNKITIFIYFFKL